MVKRSSATGTLYYDGPDSGFRLNKDNLWYGFSAAGAIQAISGKNNVALVKFTYGSNQFQPNRVTNAAGQFIDFTWSGIHVVKATDPAGGAWIYGYGTNGMLASVTSPGSTPDRKSTRLNSSHGKLSRMPSSA